MIETNSRIYVSGHTGLIGSALIRELERRGFNNLIVAKRAETDLRDQSAVRDFYRNTRPDYVILAAEKVGNMFAYESYPAEFIYDNLMIATNVIHGAHQHRVKKLLYLASSCVYPQFVSQPVCEGDLLSGPLETTNQWYAVAKIAGIKLCQAYRRQYDCNFIVAMPAYLYGPADDFDQNTPQILPALLRKFHEAKVLGASQVMVWGSGSLRREFCHVDDCAAACLHLMQTYDSEEIVNIGVGNDISNHELMDMIQEVVDYRGQIVFDSDHPDVTPVNRLDTRIINGLGWFPSIDMKKGIRATYEWYLCCVAERIRMQG